MQIVKIKTGILVFSLIYTNKKLLLIYSKQN
jgi:hypothetical protein